MINVNIRKASRCNGKWSMFLSFPYNTKILEVVRSFPSKWWNAQDKEWELPLDKLGALTEKLPDEEFSITGHYETLAKKVVGVPANFSFKSCFS